MKPLNYWAILNLQNGINRGWRLSRQWPMTTLWCSSKILGNKGMASRFKESWIFSNGVSCLSWKNKCIFLMDKCFPFWRILELPIGVWLRVNLVNFRHLTDIHYLASLRWGYFGIFICFTFDGDIGELGDKKPSASSLLQYFALALWSCSFL